MRLRTVDTVVLEPALGNRLRIRQPFRISRLDGYGRPPDSRQIRLAIYRARRGTGRRIMPLAVGGDRQAVLSQRAQLRALLQVNVQLGVLRRRHRYTLVLKCSDSRNRDRDVVVARS